MDQKGDYIIETNNQTHDYYLRKTLQCILPISILSFLLSYFSGFPFFFSFCDLQFHSLIFPLFAQALDRKCMFLICNALILAFLGGFIMKSNDEDGVKQIPELPQISAVQENAASMEYVDTPLDVAVSQEKHISLQQEEDYEEEEIESGIVMLESHEEEEDNDEEEEVVEENGTLEETLVKEEVSDMRVSTEELNKKFEEFIRRMKEEIRIEARQQYMIAV